MRGRRSVGAGRHGLPARSHNDQFRRQVHAGRPKPRRGSPVLLLGYRPRSENTAGRTVVDVSLETDNQLLEDVVVVGYGVQKKVNLTGAVASIDFSKTSESRSIISTSAALAGLAAV